MTKITQETQKTIDAALKNLKPVETYLQQRQQLQDAFRALQDKKSKTETENKTAMQRAGAIEAKRLMGQATDEEVRSLDANLTTIRDQQARLLAAEEALRLQQQELNKQFDVYDRELRVGIAHVRNVVIQELEAELIKVAEYTSSILHRLYALGTAADLDGSSADRVSRIEIPSLREGKDLVVRPYRLHPRDRSLMDQAWKNDANAVALEQQLRPLAQAKRQMHTLQVSIDVERRRELSKQVA